MTNIIPKDMVFNLLTQSHAKLGPKTLADEETSQRYFNSSFSLLLSFTSSCF